MNQFFTRLQNLKGLTAAKNGRNRILLQVLAVVITLVCLYFSFRGIDWKNFFQVLATGRYFLLPVALLISSGNYYLRALRWGTLIAAEKEVPGPQMFWANMVGYLGNQLFPARAGELIRAFYLGKEQGISALFVFATCFLERLSDVFALILIGVGCILSLGITSSKIISAMFVFLIIGVLGLIFIVLLPFLQKPLLHWLSRFEFGKKIQEPLEGVLANLAAGFRVFKDRRRLGKFILFTLVIWTIDGLGFMLVAFMFHLQVSFLQALMTLVAMGLASAIPSTPGYVGVYQFVAVLILVPFGFAQASVLAFITIAQILGYIVVILWGSIGVLRFSPGTEPATENENFPPSV